MKTKLAYTYEYEEYMDIHTISVSSRIIIHAQLRRPIVYSSFIYRYS